MAPSLPAPANPSTFCAYEAHIKNFNFLGLHHHELDAHSHSLSLTHSPTPSLTPSLAHSLTRALERAPSLTHSLTQRKVSTQFTNSLTNVLAHCSRSCTLLRTHSHTHPQGCSNAKRARGEWRAGTFLWTARSLCKNARREVFSVVVKINQPRGENLQSVSFFVFVSFFFFLV